MIRKEGAKLMNGEKPESQIPINIDMDDVAELLIQKDMAILRIKAVTKTLKEQLEKMLAENEMLKKDIDKLQKDNLKGMK